MPAFIIGSERNLAALTKAVVTERVPPALARRFSDALRAANPEVDLDRLQPGVVVEIPEVPGVPLQPASPTFRTGRFGSARVIEGVVAELAAVVQSAQTAAAEAAKEREQTLELLTSGELKESGRGAERAGPTIAASVKSLDADRSAAEARAAALKAAHEEWVGELRSLSELLDS